MTSGLRRAIGKRLPDLYLMRHGETVWNAQGRLQGALDSPLTMRGFLQSSWQRNLVAGTQGLCLASPQGRAQQTARRVFGAGCFATDPRLAEIGIGLFAGRLLTDLRQEDPALFDGPPLSWYDRCPQGEGLAALARRCRAALDDLDRPTLIVSHGITLRMLRLLALDLPPDLLATGDLRQGAVQVIRDGACHTLRHPHDRATMVDEGLPSPPRHGFIAGT